MYYVKLFFRTCTAIYNFLVILNNWIDIISEHNPFILDFSPNDNKQDDENEDDENEDDESDDDESDDDESEDKENQVVKYEDKYLSKFKKFSNEYTFSQNELELEQTMFERVKTDNHLQITNIINDIQMKLNNIHLICDQGIISDSINEYGRSQLVKFYELEDDGDKSESDDEPEVNTLYYNSLYSDLLEDKNDLEHELEQIRFMDDDECRAQAREFIVQKKLDTLINNYVLESTPLGNVYMRYNNSKKSFEYFSNNTIPYRYLEPVGRKYVMTYWCKPLFVDIDEELKKAELRQQEEMNKVEEQKQKVDDSRKNTKDVVARLKSYNKDSMSNMMVKNRAPTNTLPAHIVANLPIVKSTNEKQLLKENANRYTWEGRLSNFSPLKKVDKKVVNKKLELTFSDFKKIHMVGQNKK
jgi:hypothetical protein